MASCLLLALTFIGTDRLSADPPQENAPAADGSVSPEVTQVLPGIWRIRFGQVESFTPSSFRTIPPREAALAELPRAEAPFDPAQIGCRIFGSRCVVYIPLEEKSEIYGFGMEANSFRQRGLRKTLQVSAVPVGQTGYSHAPVPYYVSTAGYAVWVDTARVPIVHVGRLAARPAGPAPEGEKTADAQSPGTTPEQLYAARTVHSSSVVFDIPGAGGVDVYVFAGPTVRDAVQRYNLFSGGGAMPPLWGMGVKYRAHTRFNAQDVLRIANALRENRVPCDMLGLEPGWQSHAYSCSLVWSPERFPDHEKFLQNLYAKHYHVNLWEHAYIHPSSPLYEPLLSHSGDWMVWGGLVPDLVDPEARDIYARYLDEHFIREGITGFKADECDKQPLEDVTPFNYPFCSWFPSGIDGERYTQMFGTLQQYILLSLFRQHDLRTWSDVRASGSLAAPLPFLLYSDAYDQQQYLRQQLNAGLAGLLWSPEVREAGSIEELLSRIGMSVYAPQMCLDMWFLEKPPWEMDYRWRDPQWAAESGADASQTILDGCRRLTERRMALIPYLYSVFYEYHQTGMPPCRPLVLDWPDDPAVRDIDDAYMLGDALLVAPIMGEAGQRWVYLPAGRWYGFYNGEQYEGNRSYLIVAEPGEVPVFVRDNTILPIAEPVQYVADDTVFQITARVYGDRPEPRTLIEDDGNSYGFERGAMNRVVLQWDPAAKTGRVERQGDWSGRRYNIAGWEKIEGQPTEAESMRESLTAREIDRLPEKLHQVTQGTWKPSSSWAETGPDGDLIDNSPVRAFAFHTQAGPRESVTITLDEATPIRCLRILNRLNSTSDTDVRGRAATLAVWVSPDGHDWTKVWRARQPRDEWTLYFDQPVQARLIRVGLEGQNFLHLRKILIYRDAAP